MTLQRFELTGKAHWKGDNMYQKIECVGCGDIIAWPKTSSKSPICSDCITEKLEQSPQNSEAVVPLNDLLNVIAEYLANDGSNGVFDAMKLADARAKLEGLVDPKEIARRQHRSF